MALRTNDLNEKLRHIKQVFSIRDVVNVHTDLKGIATYYHASAIPYLLFSPEGFVHMGISRDGRYKKEDFYEQAHFIERFITSLSAKHVLELATGRGQTSFYLAQNYQQTTFYGIDYSPDQLVTAKRKAEQVKNFSLIQGDYHDLSVYPKNKFDIVFIVEALCYSTKKSLIAKEVKRLLRKNGVFIIIDAYLAKKPSLLTENEKLAALLTERGMAVEKFAYYEDVKEELQKAGFKIQFDEDVSKYILPTSEKFEHIANIFFSLPLFLSKFMTRILPPSMIFNVISGYLMRSLITDGIAKYTMLALEKQ